MVENIGYQKDFGPQVDPVYALYPPGASPVDSPTAAELIAFPTGATSAVALPYTGNTVIGPLVGYRVTILITWPNNTSPADLYAVDVCYSEVQPGEDSSI